MPSLTIQQAAEATGWSQRMLRYLEQAGVVSALRTPGGHRHYGPRQIERLQKLRTLIDEHGLGITDIAFELRMRTDPQLARAVDDWFGPVHRAAAPPGTQIYRRLATPEQDHPESYPQFQGEHVSITLTADKAGSVTDFKVADLSLAEFGRKEINLAEHEMPGLMALRREFGAAAAAQGQEGRRLAAHDRADRRPDRDPGRPRRRRALGQSATSSPPRTTPRPPSWSARTAPPRTPRASRSSPGRARRWRSTGGAPSRC